MKVIDGDIKLKRNETAIVLRPAPEWSTYNVSCTQVGVNRFGESYSREMFGGYDSFEDAIGQIKKFHKYPPDYLIIKRQKPLGFDRGSGTSIETLRQTALMRWYSI